MVSSSQDPNKNSKAYSHELRLTCVAAADGCVAAVEIGNILFFACTYPSAAATRIEFSSCKSAFSVIIFSLDFEWQ